MNVLFLTTLQTLKACNSPYTDTYIDELVEIFLKVSMKTVQVHLIIWTTLGVSTMVGFIIQEKKKRFLDYEYFYLGCPRVDNIRLREAKFHGFETVSIVHIKGIFSKNCSTT